MPQPKNSLAAVYIAGSANGIAYPKHAHFVHPIVKVSDLDPSILLC